MKNTNLNIRVSVEDKEKIKQESIKLSHILGIKISVSNFILWLFKQHLKKGG